MYRCPKCKEALQQIDHSYECRNHHCFDIAKQGYVHLLLGNKKMTGDNQEMVVARTRFLEHGAYAFLRERIIALLQTMAPVTMVDAGCGEGYYTNEIKRQLPNCEVYGFDLSKFALRQGAKAKQGVHYAVASVADLPIIDQGADVILSIFAPIYIEEIRRICKTNGYFLKVGPGPKHLWEMKEILYEQVYENETSTSYEGMKLIHQECIEKRADIQGKEDIAALFSMTPYAYRSPKQGKERLLALDALTTLLQFQLEIWQKQED